MTAAKPVFARHETFFPRVGWLWKAVNVTAEMPDVFTRPDATVALGVGKNMVRAIRYWGTAMRVIQEFPDPHHPRRSLARPTPFGSLLFEGAGWDPYLEDLRTVWILHSAYLRPPCMATAWQLLFGELSRADFTEDEAVEWLSDKASRQATWPSIAETSLRRDVQCMVQMYGPTRNVRSREEGIESPFREIGMLLSTPGNRERWRFAYGAKPGLTNGVIAFACLDFASREATSSTITVSRLALQPNSPGQTLRMTEGGITQALESVAAMDPRIELLSQAGVRQLAILGDPSQIGIEIMAAEYQKPAPTIGVDELFGVGAPASEEAA